MRTESFDYMAVLNVTRWKVVKFTASNVIWRPDAEKIQPSEFVNIQFCMSSFLGYMKLTQF